MPDDKPVKYAVCSLYADEDALYDRGYGVLPLSLDDIRGLLGRFDLYRKCLEVHPHLWSVGETFGDVRFYDSGNLGELEKLPADVRHRIVFLLDEDYEVHPPLPEDEIALLAGVRELLSGLLDASDWTLCDIDPFEGAEEIRIQGYEMTTAGEEHPWLMWGGSVKHTDSEISTPSITEAMLYGWEEEIAQR